MSAMQIVVIVLGAALGYWLVSFLFNKKAKPGTGRTSTGFATDAHASGGKAWFDVLEVSQYATGDEVKIAYQRLISQYHPDKVASLGADLQSLAEAKSKDLNAAYREAMRLKGGQA